MVNVAPIGQAINYHRPLNDPSLNVFICLLSSMAVIGGFLFGYDTGIVSGAMLYIHDNQAMRPINHMWQELIVSLTPGILFSIKMSIRLDFSIRSSRIVICWKIK
jgi:SP family myo-inositol transporter-like MFS transporter 13